MPVSGGGGGVCVCVCVCVRACVQILCVMVDVYIQTLPFSNMNFRNTAETMKQAVWQIDLIQACKKTITCQKSRLRVLSCIYNMHDELVNVIHVDFAGV